MRLQIRVNPETQVIEDAKFKTFGCGSAIASSSLATEWVKGKTIAEALTITNTDIVKELALPPVKIHCSVLAEDAIRAAIGDWKKKNNVSRDRRRSRSCCPLSHALHADTARAPSLQPHRQGVAKLASVSWSVDSASSVC